MTQTSKPQKDRLWLVIKILVIANVVAILIATGAGYVAIKDQYQIINSIQIGRVQSRYDSCILLKNLVTEAATPSRQKQLKAYIGISTLANCNNYSKQDIAPAWTTTTPTVNR